MPCSVQYIFVLSRVALYVCAVRSFVCCLNLNLKVLRKNKHEFECAPSRFPSITRASTLGVYRATVVFLFTLSACGKLDLSACGACVAHTHIHAYSSGRKVFHSYVCVFMRMQSAHCVIVCCVRYTTTQSHTHTRAHCEHHVHMRECLFTFTFSSQVVHAQRSKVY